MRFHRLVAALAAFALLSFLPFVAPGSANAATGVSSASSAPQAPARAERKVGIKIVKKNGRLIMKGRVTPPKGPVFVQKATKCNKRSGQCNWKAFRKVPVKKGNYSVRVFAPSKGSWYWRARVGAATSDIWQTYKRF